MDQTNWRKQLQTRRIKFDDDQKAIFLAEMRRHGRKGQAAEAADVSLNTVRNHVDNDPDFKEAYEEAETSYRDRVVAIVQQRGQVGVEKGVYNKDGRVQEWAATANKEWIVRLSDGSIGLVPFTEELPDGARHIVVPSTEVELSDRMLELEAKRVEPGYRDKSSIDLGGAAGGVIVVPATATPEQEEQMAKELNEAALKRRVEALARKNGKTED